MRSSKSRSRSKSNRQRTLGNIINRVFDSSGPEGKVRGTPQQIIDKYLMLARDAHLSNDRVAEQNFLQHAEHYTRLLGEAQKEQQREQEQRQQQNQHQQGGQNGDRGQGGRDRYDQRAEGGDGAEDLPGLPTSTEADEGPGLVETPEARAASGDDRPAAATVTADAPAEAAAPATEAPRRERKPRGEGKPAGEGKPRAEGKPRGEGDARGPRRPREKRGEAKDGNTNPDASEDTAPAAN